jgi:ORF6N domain-containing protein
MLDADLAVLYGVPTGSLNQAVDRNRGRFPADFAFRLTADEKDALKSQIVISNRGRGGRRRTLPRAFTEEGVAMLSSVLRSPRAVAVNVLIMRAFVRMRRMQGEYAELRQRLEELEVRIGEHLTEIWQALDALEDPPVPPRRPLGFRP